MSDWKDPTQVILEQQERIEELKANYAELESGADRWKGSYLLAKSVITKLQAELKAIHSGQTVAVEYNLSPAMKEGAIRNKLIELGWTPPEGKDDGGT